MPQISRRHIMGATALGAAHWSLGDLSASATLGGGLALGTFRFDVTPPLGHPCCGGWISPVKSVEDPLEGLGIVLVGAGKPVVLCVVDWTGILNGAHLAWREALAQAAGTTPERVLVHCVHQHDAPFACLETQKILAAQEGLAGTLWPDFNQRVISRAQGALALAVQAAEPVTRVARGSARVERVASNRRMDRDATGKVKSMRGSACKDERLIAMPEGTIDPELKTIAFFSGARRLACLHTYATHPMSHYGQGKVSSDFAGLARKRVQAADPGCLHLYLTGCAGNLAAGKYNDGTPRARAELTDRLAAAMTRSLAALMPGAVGPFDFRGVEICPGINAGLVAERLREQITNQKGTLAGRSRPGFELAWLERVSRGQPIVLGALHLGDLCLLSLPGECFVEYQLQAQKIAPNRFVATAAYGDGGPWYIPTRQEYPCGGYEVSVAFCQPGVEELLTGGIRKLLL